MTNICSYIPFSSGVHTFTNVAPLDYDDANKISENVQELSKTNPDIIFQPAGKPIKEKQSEGRYPPRILSVLNYNTNVRKYIPQNAE
jgi:hypothetical protein